MNVFLGIICGLFLAFANGANDNFKGVATLFGSKTTDYKKALLWATVTTGLGSFTALIVAQKLIISFSGKGFVPDSIVSLNTFSLAFGLAAAITVYLATRFGFPISTTHALIGGLFGAGIAASPSAIHYEHLAMSFFLPLIVSPVLAISGTMMLGPLFTIANRFLGIHKELCVCVGQQVIGIVSEGVSPREAVLALSQPPSLTVDTQTHCIERYQGNLCGINIGSLLDRLHFLSAGVVSFARGLNDTPKIAAILLAGSALDQTFSIITVSIFIACGGLIHARRVADTMSLKITEMNHAEGLTANLVTSTLVIFASRWGLPVSTTHVSCGALFGLGAITGKAEWKSIISILASWLVTLPVALILGYVFFWIFRGAQI